MKLRELLDEMLDKGIDPNVYELEAIRVLPPVPDRYPIEAVWLVDKENQTVVLQLGRRQ